ncbi:hypothetical protein [Clostridium perfringens]|uniref:Uncharacterized protein n=1 Tax=Clostridium perfringens E str. JGS1987 TaxID=451755 RepID=B1BVM9_CLOPF|nr:hypothetical protein [Clostridium perfringens]EDT14267.1 conserved hypothetical protein [Clostridium perfringens E str. JGS1987]
MRRRSELIPVLEYLEDYLNSTEEIYCNKIYKENSSEIQNINIEGENVFNNFINKLKSLRPISDKNILKENYSNNTNDFFKVYSGNYHIYRLAIIKNKIINNKWRDAIEDLLDFSFLYDILREPIYYSIIDLI